VLALNASVRKSPDLLEFNQTQNAAAFSSKRELVYKYITPSSVGHFFRLIGETWYFFATVVRFDLISNLFSCRYANTVELLE